MALTRAHDPPGDLDRGAAADLRKMIDRAVGFACLHLLIVDLTGVRLCAADGQAVLADGARLAGQHHIEFRLITGQ